MKLLDALLLILAGVLSGILLYELLKEEKYYINLEKGWNYVSIPFVTSMKASDLMKALENAGCKPVEIIRWDVKTQQWQSYTEGMPPEADFDILPYEGYIIACEKSCKLEVEGESIKEHTYSLPALGARPNVIFIGIPFITNLNASDLYNMLENPVYICKYSSGTSAQSICYPPNDFPLKCNEAYFVGADNTRDITFTLKGTPCKK